jgi:hypothetical protein
VGLTLPLLQTTLEGLPADILLGPVTITHLRNT